MSSATGQPKRIVVVGGGLAGTRTCEQLRRKDYEGELTMVAAERHAPYDRPPLSKEVLRGDRDDTALKVQLGELGVQLMTNTAATGVHPQERVVHTRTTETVADLAAESVHEIGFDGLVIATGAAPVTLPGSGEQFVVRTIDDAHRLRERMTPGARVVVVGASWIGAEVASSALSRGCQVTCVEAGPTPVAATLGPAVGKRLTRWWDGVDLRVDTPVQRIDDGAVVLADGSEVPADVVVVGVGVRPQTGWLAESGLRLDRGVVVDEWLRACPGVVAVGDVAAWWSRRYATRMRTEHWDDAAVAPAVAAGTLLSPPARESMSATDIEADVSVHDPVPYFWSDQFGHKLQYVGQHDPADAPIWREPPDGKGWSAAWLDSRGRLAAVVSADRPREMLAARRALTAGATPDPARLADASVSLTDA
jgi:NADPH-dependent 2,4-dienoyl-CoA reductase/sulfur reductase-like enzyme